MYRINKSIKTMSQQRPYRRMFLVLLGATLVVSSTILPLSSAKANYDGCEQDNDSCTCENTGRDGYCAAGPLKRGIYCHCG